MGNIVADFEECKSLLASCSPLSHEPLLRILAEKDKRKALFKSDDFRLEFRTLYFRCIQQQALLFTQHSRFLFRNIPLEQFFDLKWNINAKCPESLRYSDYFNLLASFTSFSILKHDSTLARVMAFEYYLYLQQACFEQSDYSSAVAIKGGCSSDAVLRSIALDYREYEKLPQKLQEGLALYPDNDFPDKKRVRLISSDAQEKFTHADFIGKMQGQCGYIRNVSVLDAIPYKGAYDSLLVAMADNPGLQLESDDFGLSLCLQLFSLQQTNPALCPVVLGQLNKRMGLSLRKHLSKIVGPFIKEPIKAELLRGHLNAEHCPLEFVENALAIVMNSGADIFPGMPEIMITTYKFATSIIVNFFNLQYENGSLPVCKEPPITGQMLCKNKTDLPAEKENKLFEVLAELRSFTTKLFAGRKEGTPLDEARRRYTSALYGLYHAAYYIPPLDPEQKIDPEKQMAEEQRKKALASLLLHLARIHPLQDKMKYLDQIFKDRASEEREEEIQKRLQALKDLKESHESQDKRAQEIKNLGLKLSVKKLNGEQIEYLEELNAAMRQLQESYKSSRRSIKLNLPQNDAPGTAPATPGTPGTPGTGPSSDRSSGSESSAERRLSRTLIPRSSPTHSPHTPPSSRASHSPHSPMRTSNNPSPADAPTPARVASTPSSSPGGSPEASPKAPAAAIPRRRSSSLSFVNPSQASVPDSPVPAAAAEASSPPPSRKERGGSVVDMRKQLSPDLRRRFSMLRPPLPKQPPQPDEAKDANPDQPKGNQP